MSDDEINAVIEAVSTSEPQYVKELVHLKTSDEAGGSGGGSLADRDEHYEAAIDVVVREGRGSVSLLQRALGIGYGRAARLIDYMAEDGYVGPYNGSQAREVLISVEDWQARTNPGAKQPAAAAPVPALPPPRRSNRICVRSEEGRESEPAGRPRTGTGLAVSEPRASARGWTGVAVEEAEEDALPEEDELDVDPPWDEAEVEDFEEESVEEEDEASGEVEESLDEEEDEEWDEEVDGDDDSEYESDEEEEEIEDELEEDEEGEDEDEDEEELEDEDVDEEESEEEEVDEEEEEDRPRVDRRGGRREDVA